MSVQTERFFALCPRGLEPVLREELIELAAGDIQAMQGGVSFNGPFDLCYAANLESRCASRVLWRVFHGPYRDEHDVYECTRQLPWPTWFGHGRTIKVRVNARQCPLKSLHYVTLRIKDAVCDRFAGETGARPNVDTAHPDIRIEGFLERDMISVYVDTSGEPLFKRGLRKATDRAPLRENLAAGILRLSGWTGEEPLMDPMCGGGTILMEAAQIALNIAPGSGRRFAFEMLNNFDAPTWRNLLEARRSAQKTRRRVSIHGSDRSGLALKSAQTNLEAAGLADSVKLTQVDVLELRAPEEAGVLVANPPYGIRTGEADRLADLYPRLGDVLKQRFSGWRAYFFTADLRLSKLIGLACSRRTPLFNGAVECRLFEFKLYQGSLRGSKRPAGERGRS